MIHVLHIGKFLPPVAGGMENFLGDLLPALERAGVQTAALVHRPGRESTSDTQYSRFRAFYAPCHGTLMYAPISPLFPVVLRRALRRFRPDILHVHVPNTSAFWGLLLPEALRLPWVVHWHSDVVPSDIDRRMAMAYPLYRPLENRLLGQARRIVPTSEPYRNSSHALTGFREKCRVIPLGIDPTRLAAPSSVMRKWAETMWGRPDNRILAIGRLTYYKGHEVLLEAVRSLPDSRLILVGSGNRKAVLKNRIDRDALADRVYLAGSLADSEVQALLATCDCLCLPSTERTEAFGLVLLEAMRYGKPVIASDIIGSGIGWVVQDGETGFLTPPGDAGSLARNLRRLLGDPQRLRDMGTAAYTRFSRIFCIDRVAREILAVYREICWNKIDLGDW